MLRRLWPLSLLFCAAAASTHAAEGEPPRSALQGRLYADLGAIVAIPRSTMTRDFDQVLTGASFGFGVGKKGIPATLGLVAHQTFLGSSTWNTGESGLITYNGQWGLGDFYLKRSLDVRGLDLVLRLEPDSWRVRPFVELRGGILQLHCTWTLDATITNGNPIAEREETGDITWSWAYGGGVRIQVYRSDFGSVGDIVYLVSFGVRIVRAGALRYLEPHDTMEGGQRTSSFSIAQPAFQSFEPFLLVGIESRSRSAPP